MILFSSYLLVLQRVQRSNSLIKLSSNNWEWKESRKFKGFTLDLEFKVNRPVKRSLARKRNRYSQTYEIHYSDTFSPMAKLASVHSFISIVASQYWPLHQLYIKNVILHGNLQKEVNMEQPSNFIAQGEYGKVCHVIWRVQTDCSRICVQNEQV